MSLNPVEKYNVNIIAMKTKLNRPKLWNFLTDNCRKTTLTNISVCSLRRYLSVNVTGHTVNNM